jgi:hypothetical protein
MSWNFACHPSPCFSPGAPPADKKPQAVPSAQGFSSFCLNLNFWSAAWVSGDRRRHQVSLMSFVLARYVPCGCDAPSTLLPGTGQQSPQTAPVK